MFEFCQSAARSEIGLTIDVSDGAVSLFPAVRPLAADWRYFTEQARRRHAGARALAQHLIACDGLSTLDLLCGVEYHRDGMHLRLRTPTIEARARYAVYQLREGMGTHLMRHEADGIAFAIEHLLDLARRAG